jgi:hypothetical protein
VPFSKVRDFFEWFEGQHNFFPLWCVPYRPLTKYPWVHPEVFRRADDELYLDIAIYGMKQRDGFNEYRLLEQKLAEVGGIKTLISHNYYRKDEFWRLWNKDVYEQVKAQVDPQNVFRDLYSKMCREAELTDGGLTNAA